jgi:signal peptidase I
MVDTGGPGDPGAFDHSTDDASGLGREPDGSAVDTIAVEPQRRPWRRRSWVLFGIWVGLFVGALVLTPRFVAQIGVVHSNSMLPAFETGDRVLVEKMTTRFGELSRGSVVVLSNPDAAITSAMSDGVVAVSASQAAPPIEDVLVLKRIIAIGGDVVEMRDRELLVNRRPVVEPYLAPDVVTPDFGPVTVPNGHLFVLGDNRNASRDSRDYGTVPDGEVVGRVIMRLWPPSRWGRLEW